MKEKGLHPEGKETEMSVAKGTLEVICGPMFSKKSDELIDRLRKAETYGHLGVQAFKPEVDKRYGANSIDSHDGNKWDAVPIKENQPELILTHLKEGVSVVGIDEAQFFNSKLVGVVKTLIEEKGIRVIIAGLDMDFRGEPFGPVPQLLAMANVVEKRVAYCDICGQENATRTQRLVNGEPAKYSDPVVVIGAKEQYGARCLQHHEVGK